MNDLIKQQQIKEDQDRALEHIHANVKNVYQKAQLINEEITTSTNQIEIIDKDVMIINNKMETGINKMKKFITEDDSNCKFATIIILLFILVVLLILITLN